MKFGVMGSYGEGNIGDETILRGIIQQIRSHDKDTEVYIFTHNAKYTQHVFPEGISLEVLPAGLRSKAKQKFFFTLRKTFNTLKSLDGVLIGGGGIFYDDQFSNGRNPIKVWHTRMQTIHSLKVPMCLFAVGIAELKYEESKAYMREICDMAEAVSVRDNYSKEILRKLGVTMDIDVVPDPAWYAHFDTVDVEPTHIGISLRYWEPFVTTNPDHCKLWAQYFEWLAKHGPLKFLAFSWRKDDDMQYLSEIMKHTNVAIETPILETPEQAFHEISTCTHVFGMRLHSQIFSIKAKRPFGALAYHEKVKTQLEKFNVPILPLESVTLESLCAFSEEVFNSTSCTIPNFLGENAFEHIVKYFSGSRLK